MDIPYGASPSSDEDVCNACREAIAAGGDASDVSLERCAQSGESWAFDRLIVRYWPRVIALALRYTRNPAHAEDATQETFMRAYRGLRKFRCESAFYTWLIVLRAIARGICHAHAALTHLAQPLTAQTIPIPTTPGLAVRNWKRPTGWRLLRRSVGCSTPFSMDYRKSIAR
jgi:hypothetical protein